MNVILAQSDQLSFSNALFQAGNPADSVVLMIESMKEFTEVPFHKQSLILILSAMRHFSEEIKARGYTVAYFHLCSDPVQAIRETLHSYGADTITLMQSAGWGADDLWLNRITEAGGTPKIIKNNMFISARGDTSFSLQPGKPTRMEPFYRKLRKATGILMKGGAPEGGRWNYDVENRRPPGSGMTPPPAPEYTPDSVTEQVIQEVQQHFPKHFGDAEPFSWPVTRQQAISCLEDFFDHRFAHFGAYQDAMLEGEDTLFHAQISGCLNIGLLDPETVCRQAQERYEDKSIPLNGAEGFIRQILGWREYVYQLYRANMPGYDTLNFLEAELPLPSFYWSGHTRMNCVRESVRPVLQRGLSHHIQRLMVTGNFALLAGVSPQAVNEWYWLGFIDAWHWVVTPNVIGMALFADGGLMASKPYAASANYIHRMSNYCGNCSYNHKQTTGKSACPFNVLYWDFLHRNRKKLSKNPRMALAYKNMARKGSTEMNEIQGCAEVIREALSSNTEI